MNIFLHMLKGDIWHISLFKKPFNVGFFLDTIKARAFKLFMIITFLGVHIVILSLITLTLFITFHGVHIIILSLITLTLLEGHMCVRSENCKLHVLDCHL